MSEGAAWATRLRNAHRASSLAVRAILISLLVYPALGLVGMQSPAKTALTAQNRASFYAAAFFLAVGSIGIRRTQFRMIRLQSIAIVKGSAGLIAHLMRITIISAAMAELIGLLGLALFLGGGAAIDLLYTGGIGIVVAAASYPRKRAWERTVDYFEENGMAADSAA